MRMLNHRRTIIYAATGLLGLSVATTAVAQRSWYYSDYPSQSEFTSMDQQRSYSSFNPQGWVSVATDFDQDGQYDKVQTIHYQDLQEALRLSEQRLAQGTQGSMDPYSSSSSSRSFGMTGGRGQSQSQNEQWWTEMGSQDSFGMHDMHDMQEMHAHGRTARITGELLDKRTVMIGGKEHLVAQIRNSQGGTAKVCLGEARNLRPLGLQMGDWMIVDGIRSRLNDRPIIMAQRIEAKGQVAFADLPPRGNMQGMQTTQYMQNMQGPQSMQSMQNMQFRPNTEHIQGELISKQIRRFQNRAGEYVVARVRTDDGMIRTVNLGPQWRLNQLYLQQGDEVAVTGQRGRINGEPAVIADRVRANDQTVIVRPEQSVAQFSDQGF